MKKLIIDELEKVLKELLDDIIRRVYHNAQCGIRSVVYNVVEQVMLDQLRKDVSRETLNAHTAKLLDINTDADRILMNLLTSSPFMSPMTTSVQRKTDTTVANKNTIFAKALKMEPMAGMEVYGDIIDKMPRQ